MNRGSKYWQDACEQKVTRIEKDVLGLVLFAHPEKRENKRFWLGSWQYSALKIAIALSDFSVLIWIMLVGLLCTKLIGIMSSTGCQLGPRLYLLSAFFAVANPLSNPEVQIENKIQGFVFSHWRSTSPHK